MRTAALALMLAVAAVSGCSSSSSPGSSAPKQPPVSAFPAGTCRVAAPDILAIGREARALGKGGDVSSGALARLTAAQERLIQLAGGAEPVYQPSLNALTVSVGLVRLAAKVGSYRPLKELRRVQPNISLDWIAEQIPFKNDVDRAHYLDGLRRAGLR